MYKFHDVKFVVLYRRNSTSIKLSHKILFKYSFMPIYLLEEFSKWIDLIYHSVCMYDKITCILYFAVEVTLIDVPNWFSQNNSSFIILFSCDAGKTIVCKLRSPWYQSYDVTTCLSCYRSSLLSK